jgi:hypothetical protein
MLRLPDGSDDEPGAIGGDLDWPGRIDLHQIENGPVQDECIGVSMFDK